MYELSQPDDDQYRLRICHVSRRDIGPLTCTARNRHGTQACSVTLELAGESQSLQPSSSPLVPILTGFSQDSLYQPSQKWPSCVPPGTSPLIITSTVVSSLLGSSLTFPHKHSKNIRDVYEWKILLT